MLRDQIFNHPGSLLAGCLIWVPIGIWVLALLQWAIVGDIDFLSALAGIIVGLGLGGTALLAREPYMAPLILCAVLVTMFAFPVVRSTLNKRELDQIDIDQIEKAYQVLNEKPGNASAKFKLARCIYNKGLAGHALVIAEDAVQQMPEAFFPEEIRILKGWKHYRTDPSLMKPLDCLECGHPNRPGFTHCEKCGSWFLLHHSQGKWMGRGLARKFVAAWVCLMVAMVGIPFVAGSLPPGASIPVILGLMVLAVLTVFFTFRSDSPRKA